ncbi:MAG: hypothetical protein AAF682_02485 [Planctomycetota bacterium]
MRVEAHTRPALAGRLVPRGQVERETLAAMEGLLTEHFDGVGQRAFRADLADKEWVLLLEDRAGSLRGFSTLGFFSLRHEGERIRLLVSGDTIVHREAWGSPALASSWIQAVNELHPLDGGTPLFWLLITSGFRTYRFLPTFWRSFYPRWDTPTPPARQRLLERAAAARWGDAFRADLGIVRLARPQVLRGALRELPSARLRDPHVEHFAVRNPGFARGDELVSLTELSVSNLTPAGRRMLFGAGGARLR